MAELRTGLDVWEGRANPWKLWPVEPKEGTRKMFLQKLASQGEKLAVPWQEHGRRRGSGRMVYLAMAIMNDETGRAAEAVTHYQAALDLLSKLSAASPGATQHAAAIADCYRQLSRLRTDQDRQRAMKDLEQSRAISQSLASQHADARLQAELAEAELDSSHMTGGMAGAQNLARLQQIESNFLKMVPKDPVELYELTNFLAGREPILTTRKPASETK